MSHDLRFIVTPLRTAAHAETENIPRSALTQRPRSQILLARPQPMKFMKMKFYRHVNLSEKNMRSNASFLDLHAAPLPSAESHDSDP